MFREASVFNQNLSSWSVSNVTNCVNFSQDTPAWTLPKPNFTNCTP
jgi:surface protein